ncbi:MAG TPA: nuclear transport factor 2 family protein [Candidatus Dormibacteraeota bacterium]|jgi:ketosteroid isomerase-like protein|nr:nuclear transport factor 2 family protein [Candidatus Dormibacteraeota bacterium]
MAVSDNTETIAAVDRMNEALSRRDLDAYMAALTEDCVFETTFPAPDGVRYEGQDAVRGATAEFLQSSPQARFETEELLACGDRAVMRWTYHWVEADGTPGHVRGVDVLRIRDGRISEMLAYVKG